MCHWMYGEFSINITEFKIEYAGKFSTTFILIKYVAVLVTIPVCDG